MNLNQALAKLRTLSAPVIRTNDAAAHWGVTPALASKMLARLAIGSVQNVAFNDLVSLVEGFGFRLARVSGSHHIFAHPAISELVNLQDVGGKAKPYQIRQFLKLVERHRLVLEDEK